MPGTDTLLWWLLGAGVLPVWLVSGAADYVWHGRTDIAHTSGRHESALHLLQLAEIAVPMLLFLFFVVDALTLSVMVAGVAAHAVTAWRDIRYATPRREITPGEQVIHCFLFTMPWVALALVIVLHWPVVVALFDPRVGADWRLHGRRPMFPLPVLALVLGASALLSVLPGAWEYLRTRAVQSSSNARSPTNPR